MLLTIITQTARTCCLRLIFVFTVAFWLVMVPAYGQEDEPSEGPVPGPAPSVTKPTDPHPDASKGADDAGPKMKKYKMPSGEVVEIPEGVPAPPGSTPVEEKKAAEAAKPGEKPAVTSIKRPTEPPAPPDRKEFEIRPDEEGMVQFQFRNQAWPDLLRWLAEISKMSLDWQELPNDYVNIATQRKYTIEEARDYFNRHLLARGYTMLEFDGAIQVFKTEGINSALVPKVKPAELAKLPPNRFVRTTFTLKTLLAEEIVTELQGMVSSCGKLKALTNTNRIDAMDSVVNLREIERILSDEQSEDTVSDLAKEFPLIHVRAADAKAKIEDFLGIKTAQPEMDAMNPEQQMMQQQMMQQQMMQMQQMQAQAQVPDPTGGRKRSMDIYLVANLRQNSVIAHAPPNKMAIIESLIRRIDVPSEAATDLASLESRMKVYRLASLDPEKLVKSLISMDALEPATRLEVDKDNNAIIAYASLADQITIAQVLKRLDGSARQFDVLQLRRLKAEEVAGTIKFMMGPEEKKEKNSRRSYFYYDPWGQEDKKKNNDVFKVGANNQDNQLLIWANENERAEINKLLIKLGELPPEGGRQSPYRVIDASRSPATLEYLKRLKERWSQLAPNELILPADEEFEDAEEMQMLKEQAEQEQMEAESMDEESNKDGEPEKKTKPKALKDSGVSLVPPRKSPQTKKQSPPEIPGGMLASLEQPPVDDSAATTETERSETEQNKDDENVVPGDTSEQRKRSSSKGKKSPVQISLDAKGNIVLFSQDIDALDQLEALMQEVAPPKKSFDRFLIKHRRASWIKITLEDYFKNEEKNDSNNSFMRWIFDLEQEDKKEEPQLGGKRKLRFIADNETSTLIVMGADDATRNTIRGLIAIWDIPDPPNKNSARYTKMVKVKYSRAESIAEAIKDAYRDLLSSKDKTFQENNNQGGANGQGDSNRQRIPAFDSISDGAMSFGGFSGKLSLGVEKITNTIVVSAEGEDLLDLFCEMIESLDVAAKPNGSVEVMKLDGTTNVKSLEKALKAMMRNQGLQPQQPQQQQPNGQNQPQAAIENNQGND